MGKLARAFEGLVAAPSPAAGARPHITRLFDKQLEWVVDGPPKFCLLCSRRAGKTDGAASWLLDGAEKRPNGLSLYIALSRNNARLIMWRTLERIDRECKLGLWFREIDGQLMVQHPNGHRIWLAGCKDKSEIDKFRGIPLHRVAIDEAASLDPYLSELIDDAIEPTLLDYQGELCVMGTPGAVPAGTWHDMTAGDHAWPTYHWTVLDNPHIPHASSWLERQRAKYGWSETDATYQREWLGRWVRDDDALVYHYDAARNATYEAPGPGARYCLGVDVGHDDATAFVVSANVPGSPVVTIVSATKRPEMTTAERAIRIEQLQREYKPKRTVIDRGGGGKMIAHDLLTIYGIACEPAEKSGKREAIDNVRGALKSGTLLLRPPGCEAVISEWSVLPWSSDRRDHHPDYQDDCSDALLYSYRAHHVAYRPEEVPPEPGSAEAANEAARARKRAAQELTAKAARKRAREFNRRAARI